MRSGGTIVHLRQPRSGRHTALINHFGTSIGFLAALGARQWRDLHEALAVAATGPVDLALAYVMWSADNPSRFRLMYEPDLWTWRPTTPRLRGEPLTEQWLERMEAERNTCFADFQVSVATVDSMPRAIGRETYTRLVTSLATGLAFEFVNEDLYHHLPAGSDRRQYREQHALAILRAALN